MFTEMQKNSIIVKSNNLFFFSNCIHPSAGSNYCLKKLRPQRFINATLKHIELWKAVRVNSNSKLKINNVINDLLLNGKQNESSKVCWKKKIK